MRRQASQAFISMWARLDLPYVSDDVARGPYKTYHKPNAKAQPYLRNLMRCWPLKCLIRGAESMDKTPAARPRPPSIDAGALLCFAPAHTTAQMTGRWP